jgi:hypothetical protein
MLTFNFSDHIYACGVAGNYYNIINIVRNNFQSFNSLNIPGFVDDLLGISTKGEKNEYKYVA